MGWTDAIIALATCGAIAAPFYAAHRIYVSRSRTHHPAGHVRVGIDPRFGGFRRG